MTTEPTGAPLTSITGNSDRLPRLDVDGTLVLVVPIICTSAGKSRSGAGVAWRQTIRVDDAFVLEAERGRTVVDQLRTARTLAEDAARGAAVLPGFGDAGVNAELDGYELDPSGVVVGPIAKAEQAAKAALDELGKDTAAGVADVSPTVGTATLDELRTVIAERDLARAAGIIDATFRTRDELSDDDLDTLGELVLAYLEAAAGVAWLDEEPLLEYAKTSASDAIAAIKAVADDLEEHATGTIVALVRLLAYELAHKGRSSVLANVRGKLRAAGVEDGLDELIATLETEPTAQPDSDEAGEA